MQNSSSNTRGQLYRLRATRAAFLPITDNFLSLHVFDRIHQRVGAVFQRPRFLIMTNHVVHVAAANSHYRRPARLAFQGCKAKRFLNTGMNEKIGRTIKPGELARIGAIANP